MQKIEKYFEKWKINLNSSKTENILFTRKYTQNKIFTPLIVHQQKITSKNDVKYLGIKLDKRLTFKNHIKESLRKAYGNMKTLFPLLSRDSFLTHKNKKLIYTTILRPTLTYAAPAWCHVSKTTIKPLQIYQNKCLRLINNRGRDTKISDLHEMSQIERIDDFIIRISKTFYETQLKHNKLTRDIPKRLRDTTGKNPKYTNIYKKIGIIKTNNII